MPDAPPPLGVFGATTNRRVPRPRRVRAGATAHACASLLHARWSPRRGSGGRDELVARSAVALGRRADPEGGVQPPRAPQNPSPRPEVRHRQADRAQHAPPQRSERTHHQLSHATGPRRPTQGAVRPSGPRGPFPQGRQAKVPTRKDTSARSAWRGWGRPQRARPEPAKTHHANQRSQPPSEGRPHPRHAEPGRRPSDRQPKPTAANDP
jgi:hypothetical protein